MGQLELCKLFFEAGLAIGFAFILGLVSGLFFSVYLQRKKKKENEISSKEKVSKRA